LARCFPHQTAQKRVGRLVHHGVSRAVPHLPRGTPLSRPPQPQTTELPHSRRPLRPGNPHKQ
jgi:hypothetical protein